MEFNYLMGHQLMGFESGGDFFYLLTDGLTSVRIVVDSSGDEVAAYEYLEFGEQTKTGSGSSPKTFAGGLGVHDDSADTGLLYMRRRHYDSTLARFLSRDPMGFAGGSNLYGYVGGNPVNFADPTGFEREKRLRNGAVVIYSGDSVPEREFNLVVRAIERYAASKRGAQILRKFEALVQSGKRQPWLIEVTKDRKTETILGVDETGETVCAGTYINPTYLSAIVDIQMPDGTEHVMITTVDSSVAHESGHALLLIRDEMRVINEVENPIMMDPAMKDSRRPGPRIRYTSKNVGKMKR